MLKTLDLFAGAGGFTIAGELAGGFQTVAFCEIDKYAQKVLAKKWPGIPIFPDVTKLKGADVGAVDVITGGFPCQDLSSAGRGAGIGEGTRSGLFREMLRIASEIRQIQRRLPYIVFENVPRLLSGPAENPGQWFGEFLWSLAQVGYDAEWVCLSAAAIGAPHKRERVCIVAYSEENGPKTKGCRKRKQVFGEGFQADFGAVYSQISIADSEEMQRNGRVLDGKNGIAQVPKSGSCYSQIATTNSAEVRQSGQGVYDTRISSAAGGKWEATYAFTGGIGTIWETEPGVGRVAYGIPNQSHRLGLMGNAIVPQVFAPVMAAVRDHYTASIDQSTLIV